LGHTLDNRENFVKKHRSFQILQFFSAKPLYVFDQRTISSVCVVGGDKNGALFTTGCKHHSAHACRVCLVL